MNYTNEVMPDKNNSLYLNGIKIAFLKQEPAMLPNLNSEEYMAMQQGQRGNQSSQQNQNKEKNKQRPQPDRAGNAGRTGQEKKEQSPQRRYQDDEDEL